MINKFISLSVLILSLGVLCNCSKKSEDPKPNNTLVFEDNFDNNGFMWTSTKNDSMEFKVENGHYILQKLKTSNPDFSGLGSFNDFVKNDFNKNFKLEAKLDKASNSAWGKGLIWGVDSSWNDLNFFIINDLGYYKIYRYANSQVTVYKDWTLYDTGNIGYQTNTLTVENINNQFNFYITGKKVFTTNSIPSKGQFFGFTNNHYTSILSADYIKLYR